MPSTDDLRIERLETLSPPSQVIGEAPATSRIAETVGDARRAAHAILHGDDDRLLVVIGPPSTTQGAWRPNGNATPATSRS